MAERFPRRWHVTCAFLLVAVTCFRLIYLAFWCPLDLAPDEAHYWDWSRHLDWSYYSKGPLVAWLIRGSCELFGRWSIAVRGDLMLAVRLPAVVCGSLLLASLYILTCQVLGRARLALGVVSIALTLPLITAGSTLMTIDAPYTCCWGWALVLGHRAMTRDTLLTWAGTGLLVGLGILAKYTMVLWIPSLALFLLTSRSCRDQLLRPGFCCMTAIAAGCCLPILYWNRQHDWVTFRHVGTQAGVHGDGGIRWLGPFEFVGVQAALLLIFWFLAWLAAMIAYRPWKESDPGRRYLWWMSAPMFSVFLAFSLKTAEEPNWPVTAYLSGLVLMAAWLADRLNGHVTPHRRWWAGGLVAACGLGLTLSLVLQRSDWVRPLLAWLSGPPSDRHPLPMRRFDPTCRLRGWHYLAAEVDRLRASLRGSGPEPVLASAAWTLPGELGFYCAGHPQVYSFGLALGDRHSQYDLWHPNPLDDPDVFRHRTFVFIGELTPRLRAAFQEVGPTQLLVYQEAGYPIAVWPITACRDYRGIDESAGAGNRRW